MKIKEYEAKFERVYCKHNPNVQSPIVDEGMIQFDEDSAHCLAGPFKGNYGYYKIQDCRLMAGRTIRTEAEEKQRIRFAHWMFDLSTRSRHNFKQDATCEEQLQKRLAQLSEKELKSWQERQDYYKIESPTLENPVRFYICGNDDASYTKFFPTSEAAQEELKLFLSMEPINYYLHLAENSFVFTN